MGELHSLFGCVWQPKPTVYGWVGLVVGLAVAIWVAWRVPLVENYSIDKLIGGLSAAFFTLLGMTIGELVRVFWTGSCAPP